MSGSSTAPRSLVFEGGRGHSAAPYRARFESLGLELPRRRVTTQELMHGMRHRTGIDLERLTGIRERRVCSEGEDSFTLAVAAAKDCLAHSSYRPTDLEMLVSCSISKYHGGLRHVLEPPLSLAVKQAIGASRAVAFDIANACAGMLTGIFVLNDFIRRGQIRCGMAVSGEYISGLGVNAAREVRSILSPQLASLTLGDAGVAAIVERAPEGAPSIRLIGFTTLSEHSRLCIGVPAKRAPGASMYTQARSIHCVAMHEVPLLLEGALAECGLDLSQVDYLIPHQTSSRAIEKGARELALQLGVSPKHVVDNVAERGNTASTTHFVAMYEYLRAGRFARGDVVTLLAIASGLEVGVLVFELDQLVERYASSH